VPALCANGATAFFRVPDQARRRGQAHRRLRLSARCRSTIRSRSLRRLRPHSSRSA
jgi:hypothetical protein